MLNSDPHCFHCLLECVCCCSVLYLWITAPSRTPSSPHCLAHWLPESLSCSLCFISIVLQLVSLDIAVMYVNGVGVFQWFGGVDDKIRPRKSVGGTDSCVKDTYSWLWVCYGLWFRSRQGVPILTRGSGDQVFLGVYDQFPDRFTGRVSQGFLGGQVVLSVGMLEQMKQKAEQKVKRLTRKSAVGLLTILQSFESEQQ